MTLECSQVSGGIIGITPSGVETNHLCMTDMDCQGLVERIYNIVKSWLREIHYLTTTGVITAMENLSGVPAEYVLPSSKNNQWKAENKGLYVAIHGLSGHPNIWRHQLAALRNKQPDFEIRLPYVLKRGNCSLKKAVEPIEDMIRDYITQHPGQPVCLMGVSNGARIAAELEVRLRDTKAPIKVSSVAGALSGTKQMGLMKTIGLATMVYDTTLVNEMLYQSPTANSLLSRMRGILEKGVERAYDFYASPNDFQIKPYTGSLPVLREKNVRYFLVPGESHNSIVSRVSTIQVEHCIDWMKRSQ